MCSVEQKEGYKIVDKRTEEGKEFADIRDETIEIVHLSMSLPGIHDCFQYSHRKPGQAVQCWKETNRFKYLNKLDLKSEVSDIYIKYIGK